MVDFNMMTGLDIAALMHKAASSTLHAPQGHRWGSYDAVPMMDATTVAEEVRRLEPSPQWDNGFILGRKSWWADTVRIARAVIGPWY